MEITFNLTQAQIYIPNGRLMNLKERLGWAVFPIQDSEIQAAMDYRHTYHLNRDFSPNQKVQEFMTSIFNKEPRFLQYERSVKNALENSETLTQAMSTLRGQPSEVMSSLMEEIGMELLISPTIQEKMKKLKKLKAINTTD